MSKVTVVIPNYNGEKYLRDCLDSLKRCSMAEGPAGDEDRTLTAGDIRKRAESEEDCGFDIIIVDNGSTDSSMEIIRSLTGDDGEAGEYKHSLKNSGLKIRLIRLDKNYGFSRAVNEGIKAADSEYVILLNNDTRVIPGFVSKLKEAIERDERIFSVSAKMLKMDEPDRVDNAGDLYCALGWAFARGKDRPASLYAKRRDIFSSCAGAAIYRKRIFEETGYFDEEHFAYLEDVDVGYRARINGYRNVYEPEARVYHAGSGSSGSRYNKFKIDLSSRNNIYVVYKNMPFLQLLINLPFLCLGTLIKTLFFVKKGEGITYIRGLGRGIALCLKGCKYPYRNKNILNYLRIQLELWGNMFERVFG